MQFKVGFRTDVGRKRSQNQDSGIALPEIGLFIVADGMGGHKGGEIASAQAVESIDASIRKGLSQGQQDPETLLIEAIHLANHAIYQLAQEKPELEGMGTTAVALLFTEPNRLTIGHVGDSRCYFFRKGCIWQLTRDHSLVQEKLRAGLITREEAKTDRMKNVITQSVGFEPQVTPDIYKMEVNPEDCFLVCSDGLTGHLDDPSLLKFLDREIFDANQMEKAVTDLVEAANNRGGEDNITVALIKVET